jgi:(4S)-4-hydroxy-5-phosphonooxypentane-2,3-dione isomerase
MFVVAVRYEIKKEHCETFRSAILKNAAASQRDEPGCRQFDVSFADDGETCFLYEVYVDSEAFTRHRATPHFVAYNETVKDWVVSKRIELYARAALTD